MINDLVQKLIWLCYNTFEELEGRILRERTPPNADKLYINR